MPQSTLLSTHSNRPKTSSARCASVTRHRLGRVTDAQRANLQVIFGRLHTALRHHRRQAPVRLVVIFLFSLGGGLGISGYTTKASMGAPAQVVQSAVGQQTIPPQPTTLWLPLVFQGNGATITSPNGKLRLDFLLGDDLRTPALAYRVRYNGQPVLHTSALGLTLPATEAPLGRFLITDIAYQTVDQSYTMPFGEQSTLRDYYNEVVIQLREQTPPARALHLSFRAYDGGIALRYHLPAQPAWATATLVDEATHFAFAGDHLAYVADGTEGEFQPQPLSAITGHSENPLTLVEADQIFLAITEAAVENYPRMRLSRVRTEPQTLVTTLIGSAQAPLPYTTPWRVLMIAESPTALMTQNALLYHLSPPSQLADTGWIRPGKAMRSGLSTAAALQTIDFATAHGIEYIEFDAGWYGLGYHHEFDPNSDATQVIAAIDMPQVMAYAAQQGRGVLLYVNLVALERQLDILLPLYASWGVSGLKFGFVDGRTQAGIRFVHEAVRKAATYQMVVDIHDNYRPSGMSRTYPNLLTQEGVRGNEHFPGATHNVTLPFTRFLAGPADYTFPYYIARLNVTRAHQLGAMLVFFSPLQFVLWYDSPANYGGEPELAWLQTLPTVWDESVPVAGVIGETITMARRKGDAWFVGALTNQAARLVTLPLTFLAPDQRYQVTQYSDQTPTSVAIQQATVTATETLTLTLLPSGGAALRFVPVAP